MGKRREAREHAVQFLFQHDLNPPEDLERALDEFWDSQRAAAIAEEKGPAQWGEQVELPPPTAEEAETRLFADRSSAACWNIATRLTKKSRSHAKNWDFHRIAAVDRNIMRLAIYRNAPPRGHSARGQHQRGGGHRQEIFHAGQRQIRQRHPRQNQGRTDAPRPDCEMKFADLHLHTQFFRRHVHAGGTGRARRAARFCRAGADRPRHGRGLRADGGGVRGGGHRVHHRRGTHRRTRPHGGSHSRLFLGRAKSNAPDRNRPVPDCPAAAYPRNGGAVERIGRAARGRNPFLRWPIANRPDARMSPARW